MTDKEEIIVRADPDLKELIPDYLENRGQDLRSMRYDLKNEEFENIKSIGHNMKGSGRAYGFDQISVIGRDIEEAALCGDINIIKKEVDKLAYYLVRVKVVY